MTHSVMSWHGSKTQTAPAKKSEQKNNVFVTTSDFYDMIHSVLKRETSQRMRCCNLERMRRVFIIEFKERLLFGWM